MEHQGLFEKISWTLSVGEYLEAVNVILRDERVFVVGEITSFKSLGQWTSFSLKDKIDGSILSCFVSNHVFTSFGVYLADGMEIKVGGFSRIYKPRGSLSFQVESVELLGQGSLKKAYDVLLKKLETEGLFYRKRVIPSFIKNIGLISSKDGVVIHDFMNNLKRFGYKINFLDSRVEGNDAVSQLADSIKFFNNQMLDLDIIVIIRGGGSLESLQAFNNELVAREIFASKIPIVVGIGHDVDVPISCLVADFSASTPTAVANFVNDSWSSLVIDLPLLEERILGRFSVWISKIMDKPEIFWQKIRDLFLVLIEKLNGHVDKIEKFLLMASPERNFKLGYSMVTDSRGRVVRNISQIKVGDILKTKLACGSFVSRVNDLGK